MKISEETQNLASRTTASAHVLRANLQELVIAESETEREPHLAAALKTLLLAIYQIEVIYV